ncbi:ORF6N domain-containing protein [Heliobacterium chlorum]|uniref:ORF6N domain-containing protein n=1 Tax=Heliobacterium chlorum TaxID=2698 RepID=A0ABR7T8Z9_HELCL|nr:ORF6N domain-containing protein [Heliobacterium chlorum]MBC9786578.1 ORF6N domain-containing protein [Heliobacterium chlorum]
MTNLQVIEREGQRVLLSTQLAQAYETDTTTIRTNFSRNKKRFIEGKHYIPLQGEEKMNLLQSVTGLPSTLKNARTLYLWTEKGAFMHAKSLETDRAWEAYEMLVDEYYCLKEKTQSKIRVEDVLSMTVDRLILNEKTVSHALSVAAETRKELDQLKEEFRLFKRSVSRWGGRATVVDIPSMDNELRNKLTKMIYVFSQQSGIHVKKAWCVEFDKAFYNKYKINPGEGKILGLTRPVYLSEKGMLPQAIEVVKEMIDSLDISEAQAA